LPRRPETANPSPSSQERSAPKASGGRPPKYNWSSIRREYIRGDENCTLESLSAKTGAPSLDTLKKRSGREDWSDLRREFRHQTDTKLREIDADLKAEVRGRHAKVGKAFLTLAVRGMAHVSTEKLDAIDIARFAKIGADLERKALGMEEVTVRLGRIRSPDDLDKLSEAELWQIAGMVKAEDDDDDL